MDEAVLRRLTGRYGEAAAALISAARPGELEPVPGTTTLWAEMRWAARAEGVIHLDDLLLRRVRLGLLLPEGGEDHLDTVRAICREELRWDDARWKDESRHYLELWRTHYSLPAEPLAPAEGRPGLARVR